jgi:hypothetical protein
MKEDKFSNNLSPDLPQDPFRETVNGAVEKTNEWLSAKKVSRRQMLIGGAAAFVAGKYSGEILGGSSESRDTERVYASSERFTGSVDFYQTLYGTTTSNQVLFFDQVGAKLGDSVDLEPITLPNGRILPPEVPSEKKIFEINGEWVDAKRKEIAEEFDLKADTKKDFPGATHTISVVRWAKRNDPELEADTVLDIVKHYGETPVSDHPDKTRLEYVYENFGSILYQKLPAEIAEVLVPAAVGIPFQESQYRNTLGSRTGAKGIFQFQPKTWPDFNKNPDEILLLSAQVEAAQNKLIQIINYYIRRNPGDMAVIQREYFGGDRKAFLEEFFVPAVINGYQAGQGTISGVMEWFAEAYASKEKLQKKVGEYQGQMGYDVYLNMIRLYEDRSPTDSVGEETEEYVLGVYAGASLLRGSGYEAKKAA